MDTLVIFNGTEFGKLEWSSRLSLDMRELRSELPRDIVERAYSIYSMSFSGWVKDRGTGSTGLASRDVVCLMACVLPVLPALRLVPTPTCSQLWVGCCQLWVGDRLFLGPSS